MELKTEESKSTQDKISERKTIMNNSYVLTEIGQKQCETYIAELKAKRKEQKISAEYIAKELGVSVSTVYRYEDSSIVKIPVSTFEKMCNVLGTTPAEMMGNVPEMSHDKSDDTNKLPGTFEDPKEAMEFLLKLPTVAAYGGYDPSKMDDETMVAFANEILQQLQLVSYKYR